MLGNTIEAMRSIVNAYDKTKEEIVRIEEKTDRLMKGAKEMDIKKIICISAAILVLIAASAAAAYCFFKGCPFKKKKEEDDALFDVFPSEPESEEQPETKEETVSE